MADLLTKKLEKRDNAIELIATVLRTSLRTRAGDELIRDYLGLSVKFLNQEELKVKLREVLGIS